MFLLREPEYITKHLGRQAAGIDIIPAAMIAVDECSAIRHVMHCAMAEFIIHQFPAKASDKTVMRDFAEGNEYLDTG